MSAVLTILYLLVAFALALAGGWFGMSLARSHRRLCALISLGAGSLLGVTAFAIIPECHGQMSSWALLVALASGYFLFFIITRYVYHVCPACAASHFDEATTHRFSEIAGGMMIALAIHCAADGLALAAGHQAEVANAPGARSLNLGLIVAVCVHKVPEGLALGSLLLGAGFRVGPALWRVAGVETATLIGGLLGLTFLARLPAFWLAVVVAHAGGGFLFLAIHAVFGEILRHHKGLVLSNFAAGFLLIGALTVVVKLL